MLHPRELDLLLPEVGHHLVDLQHSGALFEGERLLDAKRVPHQRGRDLEARSVSLVRDRRPPGDQAALSVHPPGGALVGGGQPRVRQDVLPASFVEVSEARVRGPDWGRHGPESSEAYRRLIEQVQPALLVDDLHDIRTLLRNHLDPQLFVLQDRDLGPPVPLLVDESCRRQAGRTAATPRYNLWLLSARDEGV